MAILKLTLKKRWFDFIASGAKKEEYREYKQYWIARLMRNGALRNDLTEVHFRNGYSPEAPFMRVKIENLTLYASKFIAPLNGENLNADKYFLISLGNILEIKR